MKIAVIGGGPAGMMSAIKAAEAGAKITLFEKNEKLGKKLFITGKGRCNLCNDCEDHEFFPEIVRNANFLYSAYYSFPPFSLMQFFENLGLSLKVERGRRVFPKSDHSSDVIKVLEKELTKKSVEIRYNSPVRSISYSNQFSLESKGNIDVFDKVIIATGGITYPRCGSTGDGFRFAEKLGHKIIRPKAGLVGLRTNHILKKELTGLSLKNVTLIAKENKKNEKIFGDLLFTHYGISGPSALSMSSLINRWEKCDLYIDFKPALSEEKLDKRLVREIESNPNKSIQNILENLSPKSLVPAILEVAKIDSIKKGHQITKEERMELTLSYKNFPLNYLSLFDESTGIITSGGIDVRDINPSTMESKIQKDLYFVGEVLDVDAFTGGYNLQIAFSTGYLAGISIGNEKF